MHLETERLRLRELVPSDADGLFRILGDPESMRFYPAPFPREDVERWIDRSIESCRRNGFGLWAVVLKDGGAFIGDCGITLQDIDGERLPELGYHIAKEHWNKGFATEAARACISYAFGNLGLETLHTYTKQDNLPSRRVAEKNGMVFVKEFDKTVMGVRVREVLYRLNRNDLAPSPNDSGA